MASPTFRTLLSQLGRRFSPRRIRIGADGAVALPGGGGRALLGLVARELCLFASVPAAHVPAKQREAMLRLTVRKLAPFDDPDFSASWTGDTAAVWYWSKARVTESLEGLTGRPDEVRCVAEALYLGEPVAGDAAQLITAPDGWHGRIWREGRLVADRWWAERPALGDWRGLLRGAGLPPAAALPAAEERRTGEQPWTPAVRRGLGWNASQVAGFAPKATLAVGFLALVLLGVELGAGLRAGLALRDTTTRLQSLEAPLQAVLDARQAAEADQAASRTLLALLPATDQTALLAEFTQRVPEARLLAWRLLPTGRIEATLRGRAPDLERLIGALEESPRFDEVRSSSRGSGGGGDTVLEMGIEAPEEAP